MPLKPATRFRRGIRSSAVLLGLAFWWWVGSLPAPVEAQERTGHLTWADIQRSISNWQREHPSLIRVRSLGKTVERREIPLLEITDHRNGTRERPEVLLVAGVHPREQGPTYTLTRFVGELLKGFGTNEEITGLVRGTVIWVVPCLNVDGKIHDMADEQSRLARDWRKNLRRNANRTVGVDLNRNFPVRWGGNRLEDPEWRASTADPAGNIYEGPAPLSEPETRALAAFISSRPLRAFLDLHSPLHSVNLPIYLSDTEASHYTQLVAAMTSAQATPYPSQNMRSGEDAPAMARPGNTGLTYTWAYYTQGTYSLNLELTVPGNPRGVAGRYPPVSLLEQEYERNGRQALLAFVQQGRTMPPRQRGTARIGRIRIEPAPVPGAAVTLTPEVAGSADYAVLVSHDPSIVVESEFRMLPLRQGFRLRVPEDAKPGSRARLELYVWDSTRGRTVRRFTLSVANPEAAARPARAAVHAGCLDP